MKNEAIMDESEDLERATYTVAETADILDLSKKTVYKLARKGEIPTLPVNFKRVLISRPALDKWLRCGCECPDEE